MNNRTMKACVTVYRKGPEHAPALHRATTQGWKANAMKRLKQLEEENRRLKKAVADLTLDKQILKEANEFLGNG